MPKSLRPTIKDQREADESEPMAAFLSALTDRADELLPRHGFTRGRLLLQFVQPTDDPEEWEATSTLATLGDEPPADAMRELQDAVALADAKALGFRARVVLVDVDTGAPIR